MQKFSKWRRDSKEQDLKRNLARRYGDTGYSVAPMEVLLSLDRDTLAGLPPSTLKRLPAELIFTLPDSALSPELLAQIPPEVIATLSPESLSRITTLDRATLGCLPVNTLSHLPPSALANLPNERLPLLPAEVLSRLPWPTIITLPPETLARLPMSTLINLPPEKLAQLSSDAISRLPPRIRRRVPEEILEAFKPLPPEPPPATSPRDRQDTYEDQPMQQQEQRPQAHHSDTSRDTDRAAPNLSNPSKNDASDTKPQRRASYLDLRRQSRRQLRATSEADTTEPGPAPASQPSEVRVTPPLGAVIAEAHDLQQDGYRRRSDSPIHSRPDHPSTQRSSPHPTPISPTSTNIEVAETSHSRTSTPRVEVGVGLRETRIVSSGSHKSTSTHRSTRQSRQDTHHERSTVPESQTTAHRPLSLDSRNVLVHRHHDKIDETRTPVPERPLHQFSSTNERQLLQSLQDREQLVADLRNNLDNETKKTYKLKSEVSELWAQLGQQKSGYETELAGIRSALAKEQGQREQTSLLLFKAQEELSGQKKDFDKKMKELEQDLLSQKPDYDKKSQEQQRNFDVEQAHGRRKLDEIAYKYEGQLAKLKSNGASRIAIHEQEMRNKDAEHETRLQQQEIAYKSQISQVTTSHSHEMQTLRERHQDETAQAKNSLNMYIESLRHKYENQIQADRDHFQREVRAMSESHHHAMQEQALEHTRKVNSLRAEGGDFIRQTSDDNLKGQFRKLKIAVEVIAEPFNLGSVVIPPGSRLDTDGFLQREKGMQRHLLRSLVWARIVDGFFSAPFGFGVLGSGMGKQMLVDLFLQWRRLFGADQTGHVATEAHTPDANFDLYDFWRDRDINRWRSATFQSIMASVTARDGKRAASEGAEMDVEDPYSINRARVQDEILKLLKEATNNHVANGIEEKVVEVTCLAAELALEIGAHRACLDLELPEKGDTVPIGPDFVDCEDGNAARGESEEVKLVVCPRFFKIGDGRNDMMTRKSIFPGEIYPVRT